MKSDSDEAISKQGYSVWLWQTLAPANKLGIKIFIVHAMPPVEGVSTKDICIHLENEDVTQLVSKLESDGYSVRMKKYS